METMDFSPHPRQQDSIEKVTLIWNGQELKSLQNLRENVDSELLLQSYLSGQLVYWLRDHYYETEAEQISHIPKSNKKALQALCSILSIPYQGAPLSQKEQSFLEQKKRIVSSISDDLEILDNLFIVATNQEELADLLNEHQNKIYLCENNYSIPISISGKTYIGIGKVILDHPFTREQYSKAGITIIGIDLPSSVPVEQEQAAHIAAKCNGYDDFHEKHTPLTTAYHTLLKGSRIYHFYPVPFGHLTSGQFFDSRIKCEHAQNSCIKKAYFMASDILSSTSSASILRFAAAHYKGLIDSAITPSIDNLFRLCKIRNQESSFTKLKTLIENAEKNLTGLFNAELDNGQDYYKMYDINYFLKQPEIERHDFRANTGFNRFLENFSPCSVQYTVNNIWETVNEIQEDLNDHANTFFGAAYKEYTDYVEQIEHIIDSISTTLPPKNESEEINDYLIRVYSDPTTSEE